MFTLNIVTPTKHYKTVEVDRVSLPSTDGVITVLTNHMDLLVSLEFGILNIKYNGARERYVISDGMFIFKNNEASLLVDSIESADEIDFERALRAKERAEARISKKESVNELKRGEFALKRSLMRLSLRND